MAQLIKYRISQQHRNIYSLTARWHRIKNQQPFTSTLRFALAQTSFGEKLHDACKHIRIFKQFKKHTTPARGRKQFFRQRTHPGGTQETSQR